MIPGRNTPWERRPQVQTLGREYNYAGFCETHASRCVSKHNAPRTIRRSPRCDFPFTDNDIGTVRSHQGHSRSRKRHALMTYTVSGSGALKPSNCEKTRHPGTQYGSVYDVRLVGVSSIRTSSPVSHCASIRRVCKTVQDNWKGLVRKPWAVARASTYVRMHGHVARLLRATVGGG